MSTKSLLHQVCMVLFLVLASGCNDLGEKKIYIKRVDISPTVHLNWYFYSLISNFSRSYVELENNTGSQVILESEILTDIKCSGDTIEFEVSRTSNRISKKPYDKIDAAYLKTSGFTFTIDTTGHFENAAHARLPRIDKKKVDIFKPHYFNTDRN